ncbi:hypothetical protein N431DRAFT_340473 [Stipitochalara longipes BDJ]|nr:hypothetical protein N431DRAFT_340473 [Stipitochalara longipes BDJ]
MSNGKPITEQIEFASVQEQQKSDSIETSRSGIHGSVDGASKRSATKHDTQTKNCTLIDDTKNDLEKEKSTPRVTIQEKIAYTGSFTTSKQPKLHGHVRECFPGLLKSCKDRWVFELICTLFALCNPLAIITILAVHQEKSLPHWPYVISINSLVSIFTALTKSAMMLVVSAAISQMKWQWFTKPHALVDMETFDSATRGPWGAFSLMIKVRKHHLASFAAFITVVGLAIDPFSQQIIQYYTCFEPLPGIMAILPRANNYTFGGLLSKPGFAELDGMMAAMMYLGTIDPPVNPSATIPFECSSGNCTFPAVQNATSSTIGICYSTMDIISYVQRNATEQYDFRYWLPDLSWGNPLNNSKYAEASVGIPDAITPVPAESLVTIANSKYQMIYTKKGIADGPGFSPEFDALFTFDTLMLNVNSSCDVTSSDIHLSEICEKHPWAVRISLYPCIKTFQSSIRNSILEEKIISTTPLRKTNGSAVEITTTANLTYSLATDSILVNGSWQTCQTSDYYTDSTPVPISLVNMTLQLSPEEPTRWYPSECVWMLDYVPGLAINQFLSWMYDEEPLIAVTDNTVITSGSIWLKPLYLNGTANINTVNSYIDGLAGAMTAIMRERGPSPVMGTVQGSQTCIHIAWVWISLPAGLVIFTSVLLACTYFICRASSMCSSTGSWRSSNLALLLHGCDNSVRERAAKITENGKMEEFSKTLVMELSNTEEGLRFVERATA